MQLPKFNFVVYLFIALLLIAHNSYAENKLSIVTEHLPPYQIVNEDYSISGFSAMVVEALLQESNIRYEITPYAWTRSYKLAQTKANTCIYSIARQAPREKLFKWVGSITNTNSVLFGNAKSKHLNINNLEDAKNYNIAVIRDDITHIMLLEKGFVEGQNLYVVENTSSLLKLLVLREDIDLILADDITMPFRAKFVNIDVSNIKRVLEIEEFELNFYLACSLLTPDHVVDRLKQGLNTIQTNGKYQHIIDLWNKQIPSVHNSSK